MWLSISSDGDLIVMAIKKWLSIKSDGDSVVMVI